MSTPNPDPDEQMRDALQRDAAQVPKPDFDSKLHHATMRRIRERAAPSIPSWNLVPLFTSAVALALLAAIAFWQMRSLPENKIAAQPRLEYPVHQPAIPSPSSPQADAPRASLMAYHAAAGEDDAALFAMLDRDAASLLPASAPVFSAPLH